MRPEVVAALARDPAFRRLARAHSARPQDAEDAIQDASLIALTKGPDLPLAEAAPWFNTVLRRRCWAVARSARTRRECPMSALASMPEVDPIESSPAAGSTAGRAEAAAQLAALEEVPPAQRQALLDLAAGYSHAEIRARRGLSPRQVERYLHKGSRRARRLAQEWR